MLSSLPGRSTAKLLAGTTCGCREARPAPPRPGPEAPRRPGPHAPAEVPSEPRAPLRSRPRCQPGGAAPARWLTLRWLSPPSFSPSLPPPASFGCMAAARTEPLNSHRSPPPPAQRWSAPLPSPAPRDARTSCLLATAPAIASGAPRMHSHPGGAPRPPDPPRQLRYRSRPLTARARSRSPLRAADPARLPHLAPGRSARVLLFRRCPSVPALPSRAGRAAVRVSWRGCSSGCAAERRARGQLLPPGAAPPPSARPASRTAAGSPAPRAQRPRPRLGGAARG